MADFVEMEMVDEVQSSLNTVQTELDGFLAKFEGRLNELQLKRTMQDINDKEERELIALEEEKRQIKEEKLLLMKKQARRGTSLLSDHMLDESLLQNF